MKKLWESWNRHISIVFVYSSRFVSLQEGSSINTTYQYRYHPVGTAMYLSMYVLPLLQHFPYLGSPHLVFNIHVLRFCASSVFTCFSFMSFLRTSLHLSFGLLIFHCPPTSIFHVLNYYIFFSLSLHMTFLSLASLIFLTYVCHTCPCSYFLYTACGLHLKIQKMLFLYMYKNHGWGVGNSWPQLEKMNAGYIQRFTQFTKELYKRV